jgi:hypothetical protein
MKRNKRVLNVICLITALSILFAVMIEARPGRFSRHAARNSNFHVLTERRHVPDLTFFWKISQKISQDTHNLSSEQQGQLKEAFWDMYIRTIALQEGASDKASGISKEMAYSAQVGIVLAGYMKTLNGIFTPEQHEQHQRHFPRMKDPEQFLLVANLRAQQITSNAVAEMRHARSHTYTVENTTDVTPHYAWATLVQVDSQTSFYHDLSQLQTLRL